MTKDEQFMSEAINEAKIAAAEGNWPMGCVIVIGDRIVARAHNTGYTDHNRLSHAELKALDLAQAELEQHRGEAAIYTTYEPCPMCFGAIVISKIKRVVSGVDLDSSGCLDMQAALPAFFQQPKFKFEVTRGVLADECKQVYLSGQPVIKHRQSGFLKTE